MWNSIREIYEELHIMHVLDVMNGSRNHAGGFMWKNINDTEVDLLQNNKNLNK